MKKRWNWIREICLLICLLGVIVFTWQNYHKSDLQYESSKDILINAVNSTNNTQSLEIYDKSTKIDGDYIYITGRIKNVGNNSIQYWKITAEFLNDQGEIIDTDYTNDTEIIKPNAMKEFEIMHKNSQLYGDVRIYVSEYR